MKTASHVAAVDVDLGSRGKLESAQAVGRARRSWMDASAICEVTERFRVLVRYDSDHSNQRDQPPRAAHPG
jgi:hypothetical protein